MAVGGAMSRTAVNSDTGVKSPMYGFVAGGVVILSIFKLSPALFWIPKATLAAIIVTAVWHVVYPPRVFYGYWKTSLVDFTASMLSFWVTLFVSTEAGIGSAVGFQLVYHILFAAFARVRRISRLDGGDEKSFKNDNLQNVPLDSQAFRFNQSIIFHNAFHVKGQVVDTVQTYNSPNPAAYEAKKIERNWSVSGERRVKRLRSRAGIDHDPAPIRVVVLDMSMVINIDTTGLVALQDLKADLLSYGGKQAELRFVSVKDSVRAKFERHGWNLYDAHTVSVDDRAENKGSPLYRTVADAISERTASGGPIEIMIVGDEKV